jgi:hypothetical protein
VPAVIWKHGKERVMSRCGYKRKGGLHPSTILRNTFNHMKVELIVSNKLRYHDER